MKDGQTYPQPYDCFLASYRHKPCDKGDKQTQARVGYDGAGEKISKKV